MRAAVAWLSPESMTARTPCSRSERMASADVARAASATAMTAAALPSMATWMLVRPWPASSSERAASASPGMLPLEQRGVADGQPVAVDGRQETAAGDRLEGIGARRLQATLPRGVDDCLRQRMLAVVLRTGDQAQHLTLVGAVAERDLDDLRLAARQRAGLVEHDGVQRRGLLQGDRVPEQDAALGAQSAADHDRGRRRQAERVRAGDDHDGDREQQRVLHVAAHGEVPDHESKRAAEQGDEDQPERGLVGEPLARRLGVLGLLDELDDLRERSVRADGGRPRALRPVPVDGGADQLVAARLLHGQALAGGQFRAEQVRADHRHKTIGTVNTSAITKRLRMSRTIASIDMPA